MKATQHLIRNTALRFLAGILVLGTGSGALAGCGGSSLPTQTASTPPMTTSAALPSPRHAQPAEGPASTPAIAVIAPSRPVAVETSAELAARHSSTPTRPKATPFAR